MRVRVDVSFNIRNLPTRALFASSKYKNSLIHALWFVEQALRFLGVGQGMPQCLIRDN